MKKFVLVSLLCACASAAFAQWGEEEMTDKPKFRDRVFTGGGIGAAFNSYNDFISVSPMVGVAVTPKLATGVQFIYRYTKYKYTNSPDVTTNDFGVSPFVRFQVYGPFFLHGEYEYLNYQTYNRNGELIRTGFNSIMAGGGIFQPVGRRAGLFLLALYNFSYQDNSPYSTPLVLRAGITAGF